MIKTPPLQKPVSLYLRHSILKKCLSILAILPLFLFLIPGISLAGQFKVIRVYDGDTFKAVGCDIEIKVRLVGSTGATVQSEINQISGRDGAQQDC